MSDSYKKQEERSNENFKDLNYEEKLIKINNKIPKFKICMWGNNISVNKNANLRKISNKTLTLYHPAAQYKNNMCWAASAATVINYIKTIGLTGFDICNRLGVSKDAGGTIYDEKRALNLYGLNSDVMRMIPKDISFDHIKKNIKKECPMIFNLSCNSGKLNSHAVVVYGWKGEKIKYWDPNNSGSKKIVLSDNIYSNFLTIQGNAYSISNSLSKY